MLEMIYGRAGTGKTALIRNRLCELAKDPENQIILLVPEQYSFESERAMLKLLGASAALSVEVLSFSRLSDLFFKEIGGRSLPTLNDIGRFSIMELSAVNLKSELNLYKRQVMSPEFINALLDISDELKRAASEPHDLMKISENSDGLISRKAREISLILSVYDEAVKSRFLDPRDDLTRMADEIKNYNFFDEKIVAVDSFKGFTAAQKKVLEKIITTAKHSIFTFCCDGVGFKDDISQFSNVEKTSGEIVSMAKRHEIKILPPTHLNKVYRFLDNGIKALEEKIFDDREEPFLDICENVEICEAKNSYDEADYIAGKIKNLVMNSNLRYRDIAVIARNIDNYADILRFSFKKYNIPIFMDHRENNIYMPIFKTVIYALKAVIGGFLSEYIFDCLKIGLTDISNDEITQIENYTLIWKITSSRWFDEWKMNPNGVSEKFSNENRLELKKINETREKIINLLVPLQNGMKSNNARGFSTAIYKFVVSSGTDKKLFKMAEEYQNQGNNDLRSNLKQSYDLFIKTLDQLVISLKDTEMASERFLELFIGAVSSSDIGGTPQGLDEVMAGSAERMRPASPKAVFIIGANEGVFPENSSSGGLFTDSERARLIASGIEINDNGISSAIDENFLCYSAVSAPSEYLSISYSVSDISGDSLKRSSLVEEIERILPNCRKIKSETFISAEIPAIEAMARHKNTVLSETIKKYFSDKKIKYMKFESNEVPAKLSTNVAKRLFGNNLNVSPSKIDVFYKCRFWYFCQYGLKAKPFRAAEIGALERGSLIHYVLEKLISEFGGEGLADATSQEISIFVKKALNEYMNIIFEGETIDHRMMYLIDRIGILLCDLAEYLAADFSQSEFEPVAEELAIDDSNEGIRPVKIKLDDGGTITVRGKIDRVDSFKKDGKTYVRVVDYKTGSKVMELAEVLYGQNLQMLVYLAALTRNGEKFFGEEIVPSGVLYMPSLSKISVVDREIEESKRAEKKLESRKMNGIILDDPEVIKAMEPDGLGIFVPVKLKIDGTPDAYSKVADFATLGNIAKHIDGILMKMGKILHEGDVAVSPIDGVKTGACEYCEFRSICGRSENQENKKIESKSFKEALNEFNGGEKHGI